MHEDANRRLSARGRTQADALVEQFRNASVATIVSSPYARCIETVEPLAAQLGICVAVDEQLGEGSGPTPTLARIEAMTETLLLCSHGDVIGDVMHTLARRGVDLDDDRLAKASTWELTVVAGEITAARYVPPPK